MAFNLPSSPDIDDPMLGFRFGVFFLGAAGIAHPLDFRFQSVDGLSVTVELNKAGNGSSNVTRQPLPEKLNYANLVLKRGMPLFSTLRQELQSSLENFQFTTRDVLVSVLDENGLPLNSWLFEQTIPVKWSLSSLDATSSNVIIEEMELTYKRFKSFSL